ncbi:protein of unknown function [Candidatus Promineifilum breve]|uniref:Uncharacterized protein n=1 Tax=Candidatus Promineifilum breve TaxID=1806508 RepID=A0A160T3E4_9CHLR|nr:hypothetical protein [Candidatus Promineifilum breve]CUS04284.2 protein of unknown function [Candidatus Promineifilum breve]
MPDRLICYARCQNPDADSAFPEVDRDRIKIAVGNSSTEALSALLAGVISTDKQSIIEDQLEALQFAPTLQHVTVDTGPIFEALRHEKQFHALAGGQRWRIKTRRESGKKAGQVADDAQLTLPDALANTLNSLNQLEEDKDRNAAAIDSLRRQIYADWCWYLKFATELKLINDSPNFGPDQPPPPDFGDDPGQAPPPPPKPQVGTKVEQTDKAPTGWDDGIEPDGPQSEDATAAAAPEADVEAAFLDGFKEFITAQIDSQLGALLSRDAQLKTAIDAQFAAAQADLLGYQAESQFLLAGDIVDWAAFTAAVAAQAATVSVFNNLAAPQNRAAYLRSINQQLADSDELLPWPAAAADSGPYQSLKSQLDTPDLPPLLAAALRLRANRLALEAYVPGVIKHRPALELAPQAADRFWRPNDPVALISGYDPTPRHQDTRDNVMARLLPLDWELQGGDPDGLVHFKSLLEELWGGEITTVPSPDWQPIFLAWDTAFSQAHQSQDQTYDPAYLQANFRLGDTDFAAVQQATYDKPIPFYGRAILTPGGSISLKNTIIGNLVPVLVGQFMAGAAATGGQPATIDAFNVWLKGIDPAVENPALNNPDLPVEQQISQWLTDELDRLDDTDSRLMDHLLDYLKADSRQPIIRQFLKEHSGADLADNLDAFLDWATAHSHIQAGYAAQHRPAANEPLAIALVDQADVRQDFVAQLTVMLGDNLQRYYDEKSIPAEQQAGYPDDHYDELIAWYQPQVNEALQLVVQIRAYRALLDIRGLAQALTGFGEALVMRHQAFQLPVYDPFPHDKDDAFAARVRAAVQTANRVAPSEDLPFSPWRAGKIALTRLELLDNFGRYWPNERATESWDFLVQASDSLPDAGDTPGKEFATPPRLAQAARLAFRWLAANTEIEEMNDHPASNPICGWVVPNYLDNSLMIYAVEGQALGYIDEGGQWRTFPGNRGPILPADIANPHLARLVQWLSAQGQAFLADFLTTLDGAQENMEPESFAQHEALALLMGRPLALVRADVRLQLQEPPAINVSKLKVQADVEAYHQNLTNGATGSFPARDTFAFEQVQIPLRLGEFHRLNDGLAGYWLEDDDGGYAGDTFYALQTSPIAGLSAQIQTRHQVDSDDRDESQFLLYLSLGDPRPRKISLLLDPRAPIHATTGILPVKALDIPRDQYQAALQRLQVAFLTAPVLAPEVGLEMSLPTEPGFDWTWLQLEGHHWSSISAQGIIRRHQLAHHLGAGAGALWAGLLQQGWLEALDGDTARIVAEDKRRQADLPPALAPLQEAVELLFHRLRIRPFDPTARLDSGQQIREGWLRLSPADDHDVVQ